MYPLEVTKVAAALGGTRTLGAELRTLGDLAEAVERGLPRTVVRALASSAAPDRDAELRRRIAALVASPATLKRSARLSPAASERAERLARVAALARQALGDEDEAKAWLTEFTSALRRSAANRGGRHRPRGPAGRARAAQYRARLAGLNRRTPTLRLYRLGTASAPGLGRYRRRAAWRPLEPGGRAGDLRRRLARARHARAAGAAPEPRRHASGRG